MALNQEPIGPLVGGWGWTTWRGASQKGRGAPRTDTHARTRERRCSSLEVPGLETDHLLEPLLSDYRVFYKVKSRSAHMKSHAEQEKKAAALRQKEKEAAAAAATAAASPHQPALREESSAGERG